MSANSKTKDGRCLVCLADHYKRESVLLDQIIGVIEKNVSKFSEERLNHPKGAGIDKLYQRIGREEAARKISKEAGILISKHVQQTLDSLEN